MNDVTVSEIETEVVNTDLYAMSDEELLNTTSPEPMQSNEVMGENPEPLETEATEDKPDIAIPSLDEPTEEIDYKAFYETMTKPFKANGRELQIHNADDAIRLMQQGANYSKKMEELKPKKALLKALEENGLADKDKLGYLIDLANKDPKAIAKLVQESEIDLYEFDTSQADDYQPNLQIHEPTAFEETLNEVTSQYPQMYEVVRDMTVWDDESKDILYNEPNILKAIAEQKQSGFYDNVMAVIEQERMLGRMTDMSMLQAYALVESKLMARQQPNSFTGTRPNQPNTQTNSDKKRSAGMPNGTQTPSTNPINILAISDEELLKLNL